MLNDSIAVSKGEAGIIPQLCATCPLYDSECWMIRERNLAKNTNFHLRNFRRIHRIFRLMLQLLAHRSQESKEITITRKQQK